MVAPFWVFDWLDDANVREPEDVSALIGDDGFVKAFVDDIRKPNVAAGTLDHAIVAGQGLDLSARGACGHRECMLRQAKRLLNHAWYFDNIVVNDPSSMFDEKDIADVDRVALEGWLSTLSYMREIGADQFLRFVERPTLCEKHWRHHVDELGLGDVVAIMPDLVESIERLSHIEKETVFQAEECYAVRTPLYETYLAVPKSKHIGASRQQVIHAAVEDAVRRSIVALASDLAASRLTDSPLGIESWFHTDIIHLSDIRITGSEIDRVAFEIELPVLLDVTPEILFHIRNENSEAFHRFQIVMREAIREKLDAYNGGEDVLTIAQRIREEKIEPEVARLNALFRTNVTSVGRAAGLFSIAAISTIIGVYTGQPIALTVPAGVSLCGPSLAAGLTAISERGKLTASDYYFAFRSLKRAAHL